MPGLPTDSWRAFFDAHAPRYLENGFTRNTLAEVDFLLELCEPAPGAAILDLGCGVGRHAVELARRGYRVTGLDFSPGMLAEARKAADAAGVQVEWLEADATDVAFESGFDAAICLCEGAINLIGPEDEPVAHDLAILRNVAAALPAGAPFLLTILNGYSIIRQMTDAAVENRSFDPATMVAAYRDTWNLPEGPTHMNIRERLYIPTEFAAMLHAAGFELTALYGGTAGDWGKRPLKLDEIEAMYLARRRA